MNKALLTGRISQDLELRKTSTNTSVLSFNLAVDKGIKDENGNRKADFIKINTWGSSADFLHNYAEKGSLIAVTGRIDTNSYINKNNQKVYETFVTAESVELLSRSKTKKETSQEPQESQEPVTTEYLEDIDADLAFY